MSRIGQSPVNIKENVEAILENKFLKLKGPKGYLEMEGKFTVVVEIWSCSEEIRTNEVLF